MCHEGQTLKIDQIDISRGLIKSSRSFLHNRKFKVKLEDHLSSTKEIRVGVPQGSVLGPILYNIFTYYDIPEIKNTSKVLFADDTALGAQSQNPNMAIEKL